MTSEPAFGFAGESFAALVETVVALPLPPEPPPLPPPEASLTTTVAEAMLLEASGSETDVWMISARRT